MYIFLMRIGYKIPVSIYEFILPVTILHVDSIMSTILSTHELRVRELLFDV